MDSMSKLIKIAHQQAGLFTASQAENAGFNRTNHSYHVSSGNWVKEGWGLYSLPLISKAETSFYWKLYLWTRNKYDKPQAVISHETALNIHELSDINPTNVHFTVPKNFRKTAVKPKGLILHKENIDPNFITTFEGLNITNPIKTLIDVNKDSSCSIDILEQAVKEALKKGLVSKSEIKKFPELLEYAL